MQSYPFSVGVLVASLVIYAWAIIMVGRARGKYKVDAPAVTGDPAFERAFRAQQNSVEQMVLFVPLLALAAHVWGDTVAGVYGLCWCIGRVIYIVTYSRGVNRSAGFMLSGGLSAAVLLGIIVTYALRHLGIA